MKVQVPSFLASLSTSCTLTKHQSPHQPRGLVINIEALVCHVLCQVSGGNVGCLYEGALAASAATAVGYFPWFLTFNYLNRRLKTPMTIGRKLLRNAGIGLAASIASDVCSNSVRVIKTTKQAAAAYQEKVTYRQAATMVLRSGGWTVRDPGRST